MVAIRIAQEVKKIGAESPFDILVPQGQPLSARTRKEIADLNPKAKGRVLYAYSNTECMEFPECEAIRGWHMAEDFFVLEVINPETGERVAEGEEGEYLVTSFIHHTMPLIRFSMEDVAYNKFATEPCKCGRTHARGLEPIPGRVKDMFKVKGKALMPWDVEVPIADIPETTRLYQLIYDAWDMDAVKVKVETTRKLPDASYEKMARTTLEERLGVPVELEMIPPGGVPIMAGGYKVVNVVDNRPEK
jgi:phenylacetate-CoA ligase